jgi:hypothetical protein
VPEPLDYWRLVDVHRSDPVLPEALRGPDDRLRRRDGFTLTDPRMSPRAVLGEIHDCVLCHERDKDSCSKGLHDKAGAAILNPLGITLHGCPLDEKISEMHALRKAGDPARLRQNTVQEKLANMWLDHLLESQSLSHV